MNFFKKTSLLILISSSLSVNALEKSEWIEIINDSIETEDNLNWNYNPTKLKDSISKIKEEDIEELKEIANGDDVLLAEASKYLLATQGNKTSSLALDNYLKSDDVKSGLYYFNLNFLNTLNKETLWNKVDEKKDFAAQALMEDFKTCKNFKDYSQIGGVDFTFTDAEDFFKKRDVIKAASNVNLLYLEFELNELEYPVTATIYKNDYIIQSENDKMCSKINEDLSYVELQKIMVLYKQHNKKERVLDVCDEVSSNSFISEKLGYLCSNLKYN